MTQQLTSGAVVQPPQPLSEPYILWDSRSWDGTTGPGSGGLPNEGTAGSVFDLDVIQRTLGDGYQAYYGKRGPGPTAADWVVGGLLWADLGGPPCDGPFTIMAAFGDFPTDTISGVRTGWPDAFSEGDLQLRTPAPTVHFGMNCAIGNGNEDSPTGQMFAYTNNDAFAAPAASFFPDYAAGGAVKLREELLVLTMDPVNGGGSMWVGSLAVPPQIDGVPPTSPLPEELWVDDTLHACGNGAAANGEINLDSFFIYFGEHRGYAPITAGDPWNGLIGFALFRGEPTPGDITYWTNYFLAGYTPATSPLAYTGGTIRVDSTYVYHSFPNGGTLVPIPGATLPATVDVFLVGGGGQAASSSAAGGRGGAGGGGQVNLVTGHTAPTTSKTVVSGNGGNVIGGGGFAGNGSASSFDGLTAAGGRGASFQNGGRNGTAGPLGGTGYIGGVPATDSCGGGGGGAGGAGGNASSGLSGDGGPGTANDWRTGTTEYYGVGGTGGGQAGTTRGVVPPGGAIGNPPTGFGGGATAFISSSNSSTGPSGARGTVIIRYPRQD
jgi:hypothetical protein